MLVSDKKSKVNMQQGLFDKKWPDVYYNAMLIL